MSELKMSYEKPKTSVILFVSFENVSKQHEGSHERACNWHENHMGIQLQKVQIGYMLLDTHMIACQLHYKLAGTKPITIENFVIDMINAFHQINRFPLDRY